MAKFTGSFITQRAETRFFTHLVPLHSETALCGAVIRVKGGLQGLRLSLTSRELSDLLYTLLKHEATACQGCLSEIRDLD
jgi:hypothetical protein